MEEKFFLTVKQKLRRKGYKLTGPRLAIIEYLIRIKGHPGIREIFEGIRNQETGIGMATVYRTIDLFCELGILRALTLKNNHVRYELNWPDNHHHHLICKECESIVEFASCNFQLIARDIEKTTHFKIEEHTVEAYGLCPRCLPGQFYGPDEKNNDRG